MRTATRIIVLMACVAPGRVFGEDPLPLRTEGTEHPGVEATSNAAHVQPASRQVDLVPCEAAETLMARADCMATHLPAQPESDTVARAALYRLLRTIAAEMENRLHAAVADPASTADIRFIAGEYRKLQDVARKARLAEPRFTWTESADDQLAKQIRGAIKHQAFDDATNMLDALQEFAASVQSSRLRTTAKVLVGEVAAARTGAEQGRARGEVARAKPPAKESDDREAGWPAYEREKEEALRLMDEAVAKADVRGEKTAAREFKNILSLRVLASLAPSYGCPQLVMLGEIIQRVGPNTYEFSYTLNGMEGSALLKTTRSRFEEAGHFVLCVNLKTTKKPVTLTSGFQAAYRVYTEDASAEASLYRK